LPTFSPRGARPPLASWVAGSWALAVRWPPARAPPGWRTRHAHASATKKKFKSGIFLIEKNKPFCGAGG
jgi:hypothetical protein